MCHSWTRKTSYGAAEMKAGVHCNHARGLLMRSADVARWFAVSSPTLAPLWWLESPPNPHTSLPGRHPGLSETCVNTLGLWHLQPDKLPVALD